MDKLTARFKKIKLLACDFDGVMTDGCVYVNQDGKETIRCSRKDGLGIALLLKHGISVIVVSTETNPVVAARCRKLKIECYQKIADGEGKLEVLKRVIKDKGLAMDQVAYLGDDLNDLKALKNVELSITVADGHARLKKNCHYLTKAKGGEHAVREVCEKILLAKGIKLEY